MFVRCHTVICYTYFALKNMSYILHIKMVKREEYKIKNILREDLKNKKHFRDIVCKGGWGGTWRMETCP